MITFLPFVNCALLRLLHVAVDTCVSMLETG